MMEYPRRIGKCAGSGGAYEENYQRALKSAIEQMDLQRQGKPTGEPSLSEQRIAEQRRKREQEEKKELDHRYYVLGEQGLPVSWDEFYGNFN